MYAGPVAMSLSIGHALELGPEQVAMLIPMVDSPNYGVLDNMAAAGNRILSTADYKKHGNKLYGMALSTGFGLIPRRWVQQVSHSLHPLLESGIVLTAIVAVVSNLFCSQLSSDQSEVVDAANLSVAP
ncbi:MAG: hypothetical protein RJA36_2611 [Pseudomonadota bacterium]|jgi:xanthine/uracil permease